MTGDAWPAVDVRQDIEPIVESVRSAMEAGVDHVNLHQVGSDQDGFLRFWDETLEPALRSL